MFNLKFLSKFSTKREIIPEVLTAFQWKLPDGIKVVIKKSEDGGYFAIIENLPGCITQAETGQELFEMVNDAIYTYLDISPEYIPYLTKFLPSEKVRKELNIEIPENLLGQEIVLQRV